MDYASQSKNKARFIKVMKSFDLNRAIRWFIVGNSYSSSWNVDKINFYGIQRFLNPDKLLPIGSLSMETFVALSICPNFQATVLSEPNTNITVLQNTAIKTNFQLTPSTKVSPGYNRVNERFHQIRNLQHLLWGPIPNNFTKHELLTTLFIFAIFYQKKIICLLSN